MYVYKKYTYPVGNICQHVLQLWKQFSCLSINLLKLQIIVIVQSIPLLNYPLWKLLV